MSFDPKEHDRPPRQEGWKEETERLAELLHERGDLRIGQLLINVISTEFPERMPEFDKLPMDGDSEDVGDEIDRRRDRRKAAVEQVLWNIEAPDFVEAIENYYESYD